jgi:exodeoxyribonuclease-3
MTRLLEAGFVDTFRYLYPDKADAYSWWSYRGRAREKNVGWRIDYFLVSQRLAAQIQKAEIYADILGSDHCPVSLTLDI